MFKQWVTRHKLAVNMVQTGSLFAGGDFIAQKMSGHEEYDYSRTARAMFYGGVCFAPIGARWYVLLQKIRPTNNKVANTACRVAVDQLGFAPFIGIPMYYSVMTVLEGKQPVGERIRDQLDTNWLPTLINNWKVWPVFQFANFFFVPVQLRLLGSNVIGLLWNTYLSWTLNEKAKVNKAIEQ
ncbi:protein Sym1p [Diutina catenulata]